MDERARRIADRLAKRDLYDLARKIARAHHVTVEEMVSASRKKPFVTARHKLWRALHDDEGFSWPMVADLFEKRSDSIVHATSYQEARAASAIETRTAVAIGAYVRALGYGPLASEIEAGAWRKGRSKSGKGEALGSSRGQRFT